MRCDLQRRGDEEASMKAVEEEDDQQAQRASRHSEPSRVKSVKSQVKSRAERAGTGRPTKTGQAQEIAEEAVTRGKDAAAVIMYIL